MELHTLFSLCPVLGFFFLALPSSGLDSSSAATLSWFFKEIQSSPSLRRSPQLWTDGLLPWVWADQDHTDIGLILPGVSAQLLESDPSCPSQKGTQKSRFVAFPNPEVERGYDIECVLLDYGTEAGPVLVPGSRSGDGLSKEDLSVIRNFLERYAPDSEGEFGDPEPVDSNSTKDSDNERKSESKPSYPRGRSLDNNPADLGFRSSSEEDPETAEANESAEENDSEPINNDLPGGTDAPFEVTTSATFPDPTENAEEKDSSLGAGVSAEEDIDDEAAVSSLTWLGLTILVLLLLIPLFFCVRYLVQKNCSPRRHRASWNVFRHVGLKNEASGNSVKYPLASWQSISNQGTSKEFDTGAAGEPPILSVSNGSGLSGPDDLGIEGRYLKKAETGSAKRLETLIEVHGEETDLDREYNQVDNAKYKCNHSNPGKSAKLDAVKKVPSLKRGSGTNGAGAVPPLIPESTKLPNGAKVT